MDKKFYLLILCLFISLYFFKYKKNDFVITKQIYGLGTLIQLQLIEKNEQKAKVALDEAINRIYEIENKMSITVDNSEIMKINKNAGVKFTPVSPETFAVLQTAKEYSELTDGAFDVTIGPMVKLWGIRTKEAKVPTLKEIHESLYLVNYKDLILDEKGNAAQLRRKGQWIDLGAIAKGYVADEVKKIFQKHGISSAFIDLGGNILTLGNNRDHSHWKIGIQNPLAPRGHYLGIIQISDQSIVTSGNYERYFEKNGVRYHHILDPLTGYPSASDISSVTILSKKSIDADALSTSILILGFEKGRELIESLDGIDAIFVTHHKIVYATTGIQNEFTLTDKEFSYEKRR